MVTNKERSAGVLASIGLFLACQQLAAAQPAASPPIAFHIEPQPLQQALTTFANQAGLQLLLDVKEVGAQGAAAPKLVGTYTREAALERLLASTGLVYKFVNPHTVVIRSESASDASTIGAAGGRSDPMLRMAQVGAISAGADSSSTPAAGQERDGAEAPKSTQTQVEEIIVTAQKRTENLREVPVPVTAIRAETLVNSSQLRLQDYYTKIPGLSLTLVGGSGGAPQLTLRGLTTGPGLPTVGVVIDDVVYSSPTSLGGVAPDIDPGDLTRIEVLRGPQGTLYGASSIGGLLKFVTVDPSVEGFSGRLQGGLSSIHNGDGLGHDVRGSVNVPLGESFAVRASGFTRRQPGYIDDPVRGADGINREEGDGGRVSALWRPSQDLSLKLNALVQQTKRLGSSESQFLPGLGELQQISLPGTGYYHRDTQSYGATLNATLGRFDLTSASGYSIDEQARNRDLNNGTSLPTASKSTKFTQEIRLSTALGPRVDWLVGAFYTHEDSPLRQNIFSIDRATGARTAQLLRGDFAWTYAEYAAFTDLTFHFTDRFDVQVGGRQTRNKQNYSSTLVGAVTAVTPRVEARESPFTYLLTPRFKVSPDLMVYARMASGYRPGGPNPQCVALRTFGVDACQFDADTTRNYEIGLKADVLDHKLTFDASLYYIDWQDIQLIVLVPPPVNLGYTANAGKAKSQGVELSMEARPLAGMTLSAWVAWNDAELTEPFPATSTSIGRSGDQLPFSSPLSGNLSVDQEFPLGGSMTGFVGGSVSYVDERTRAFRPSLVAPQPVMPSYVQADLRAGVRLGSWTVNAFINNVADERGLLASGDIVATAAWYIQPRTIGMSVAKTF